MPLETELKLNITPKALADIGKHPLLQKHSQTQFSRQRLISTYYDTDDFQLRQAGFALRIRECDGRYMQTLKGGGKQLAGLHQRYEWDVELTCPELALDEIDAQLVAEHLDLKAIAHAIQPQFITDFQRDACLIEWQNSIIEFAADLGSVGSTQGDSCDLHEIELELKQGDVSAIYDLALQLTESLPLQIETVSKAARGYFLLGLTLPSVKSYPVIATQGSQQALHQALLHWQHHDMIWRYQANPLAIVEVYLAINAIILALNNVTIKQPMLASDLITLRTLLLDWKTLDHDQINTALNSAVYCRSLLRLAAYLQTIETHDETK